VAEALTEYQRVSRALVDGWLVVRGSTNEVTAGTNAVPDLGAALAGVLRAIR
jgi:hypothetical protein